MNNRLKEIIHNVEYILCFLTSCIYDNLCTDVKKPQYVRSLISSVCQQY